MSMENNEQRKITTLSEANLFSQWRSLWWVAELALPPVLCVRIAGESLRRPGLQST